MASSGGLAVSVAWQLGETAAYCIDGQVYAAGAAIAWLERWGFLRRAPRTSMRSPARCADSGGVARGAGSAAVSVRPVVAARRPRQH